MAKQMNVSLERTGPALERLPSTEPADIENLMVAIDRKVNHILPDLFPAVVVGISEQMLLQNVTVTDLSWMTGISRKRINQFLLMEKMLDLPHVQKLCLALNGKLRLAIVSRKNSVLDCDDYLVDSLALSAHIGSNISQLAEHALPEVFFQTCGLETVPGLNGGYLEKSCPIAFRLLRHTLFMRARVVLRTVF